MNDSRLRQAEDDLETAKAELAAIEAQARRRASLTVAE